MPGRELTYPTCEETFQIPDDGLSALPTNSVVDNLLKMKRVAGDDNDQGCDVCDSESGNSSPVTSYCLDCWKRMCHHCASYHAEFDSTKGHEVVHIGPLDPITMRPEDDIGAVADDKREQMQQMVEELERLTTNDDTEVRDLFRARNDIMHQVTTDVNYLKFRHFVNFSYPVRLFSCGQKCFAPKVD